MRERVVEQELLDALPAEDSEALRSRRDLVMINAVMGNARWLRRQVGDIAQQGQGPIQVVELGAGDGGLLQRLVESEQTTGLGLDLMPRPAGLDSEIDWLQGDVLDREQFPWKEGVVKLLVCNLILHHFEAEDLARIGELFAEADYVIAVEPHRSSRALALGYLAFPLIGRVTRHDMMVSIRAGFRVGELAPFFGGKTVQQEVVSWFGGLRLLLK